MSQLAISESHSLSPKSIEAAIELQKLVPSWVETINAITRLRDCVQGYDKDACLLKAVALNQLYSTNVYDIVLMAGHIVKVMAKPHYDLKKLVDEIAELLHRDDKKRKHLSFASKFTHFFVDDNCPLYDRHSANMVAFHLGRERYDGTKPFSAFMNDFEDLQANLSCSTKDLDTYLWIGGQFQEWISKGIRDACCAGARKG